MIYSSWDIVWQTEIGNYGSFFVFYSYLPPPPPITSPTPFLKTWKTRILKKWKILLEISRAVSRINCFQKTGGRPKWEVPKKQHVRIIRNHEITGKTLCVQSKCSSKEIKLPFGNEWKFITPDHKQYTWLAHVFYVDHYTTGVISDHTCNLWQKCRGEHLKLSEDLSRIWVYLVVPHAAMF